MPGAAEIAAAVVRLFSDLDDFRVVDHAADKLVDIQAAKAAAKSQMLLGRLTLVTEKVHLMVEQGRRISAITCIAQRLPQIDPGDLGTESSRNAAHIASPIAHPLASLQISRPLKFPTHRI
jgi:hypothetical protein